MRLKYYLRGAGIGILITTLVLTIAFSVKNSYSTEASLTDEEIINRATELGMIMPEQTEDSEDEEEKLENDLESEPSGDNGDGTNLDQSDEENAETASSSTDDTSVTYIPFSVKGGQSSNDVAANLYKAGLVDSAEDFNDYLNKTGVDGLIQAGTFYVRSDSTYDDLAAILVTKQADRTTSPPEQPEEEEE